MQRGRPGEGMVGGQDAAEDGRGRERHPATRPTGLTHLACSLLPIIIQARLGLRASRARRAPPPV